MKIEDLLLGYTNSREPHERKPGRYWATDLWAIIHNRITPEEFFAPKEYDLTASRNIVEGEVRELALKSLLDANGIEYNYQPKKELKIDDEITLVVVADFEFKDLIVECKSPQAMKKLPKSYHLPQLEAQFRAFEKDVYIIYLKERFDYRIYKYDKNDKLWKQIVSSLKKFHQDILKYVKQKETTDKI